MECFGFQNDLVAPTQTEPIPNSYTKSIEPSHTETIPNTQTEPSRNEPPIMKIRYPRNTTCRFRTREPNETLNFTADVNTDATDSEDETFEPFNTKEAEYETDELISLCSSSDDEENEVFPQFNANAQFGSVVLELCMEFPNKEVFKQAVRVYNINIGRQVRWVKNDSYRARARCTENCPWEIFCSINKRTNNWQVKTFNDEHTCCRSFKNRLANSDWMADKLVSTIRAHPDMKGQDVYDHMKEKYNILVPDSKVFRAIQKARKAVEGSEVEQYSKLRDYANQLLNTNVGSTILLKTPRPTMDVLPQFDKFYICFDACKRGFKAGCRPLIGLDGCHLKGYYGGQLLAAVAQDGNNAFYVIAFAVVNVESKETWSWFLRILIEDIGDPKEFGYEFITDQQKGLLPAMEELMPGVPHRFCCRHLWANFSKQWKGLEFKRQFWIIAKSTTKVQFLRNMERMKEMDVKAWEWLNRIKPEQWSRSSFSTSTKNYTLLSNMCEQFNGKIVKFRSKPIITMVDEIRCYIMRKMNKARQLMEGYTGPICPNAQIRLEKAKKDSFVWTPEWVGDAEVSKFEVTCRPKKESVDLDKHTCTCREWQLTGVPCAHACAALGYKGAIPEAFVHQYLSKAKYDAAYAPYIQAVPSEEHWEKANGDPIQPPPIKRPPGRPKKLRRKGEEEGIDNPYKAKKRYKLIECGKCGQTGHNCKSCKGPANPNLKKKSKKTTEVGPSENPTNEQIAAETSQPTQASTTASHVIQEPLMTTWQYGMGVTPFASIRGPPIRATAALNMGSATAGSQPSQLRPPRQTTIDASLLEHTLQSTSQATGNRYRSMLENSRLGN